MRNFKNLLAYVGSDQPDSTFIRAVALAIENQASLTLMDVIKPQPRHSVPMAGLSEPADLETDLVSEHRRRLVDLAANYDGADLDVNVVVKVGDPATEMIREVLQNNYDLVIKTAQGMTGITGTLFGSIARSLLRQCPCAVLVLKPAVHGEFDQVLAAIDVQHVDASHQSLNQETLALATDIAQQDKAQLHLVAAWDLWMENSLRRRGGDAEVDAMLEATRQSTVKHAEELLAQEHVPIESIQLHIERGEPSVVIRAAVEETQADLLVMGTVCRTGVAGFLIGNTAESVLTNVTCSVLALKPEGFVCPVELSEDA